MEIRYIDKNDDPLEISDIYEQSWKYAYKGIIPQEYLDSIPRGRWVNGIGKPGNTDLVMEDNGRLIGTSRICASRWERYKDFGEIVSIYLLPGYIGKGYGHMLMERCTAELLSSGYDRLMLWVLEGNTRARRFYEKAGFVCTDEYLDDNIGGKALREVMYIMDTRRH